MSDIAIISIIAGCLGFITLIVYFFMRGGE